MPQEHYIALDIETIPTVTDPKFDDPEYWIPFAIALGHRDESMTDPDAEVIFRDDSSIESEVRLFNEIFDWISSRIDGGDRVLLTYNGDRYDLPILKHRASRIRQVDPRVNVVERLSLLLNGSRHVDLILDMKAQEGYWVSLDDALDKHQIDADEPEWMGKKVTGADMPSMGLELLSDRPNDELRSAVERYASSDIIPLFKLYDEIADKRIKEDMASRE